MFRNAIVDKEVCQAVEHIIGPDPTLNHHVYTLPCVFVDNRQYFERPSIMGTGSHKIIRPNMVSVCRPKPHAGSIIKPQTTSFGLLLRDLEPLLTPDAFYAFMVNLPAVSSQKGCNTTVAVPTILTGKSNNFRPEDFFLVPNSRIISLS